MAGDKGRLYVIGDRETGVLFVKTEPLRAALVHLANIQAYATQSGISVDEAFARVAEGAKSMILLADGSNVPAADPLVFEAFFDMIKKGTSITDADFCFIADVENAEWSDRRWRCPPIAPALQAIAPEGSSPSGDALTEVGLSS